MWKANIKYKTIIVFFTVRRHELFKKSAILPGRKGMEGEEGVEVENNVQFTCSYIFSTAKSIAPRIFFWRMVNVDLSTLLVYFSVYQRALTKN